MSLRSLSSAALRCASSLNAPLKMRVMTFRQIQTSNSRLFAKEKEHVSGFSPAGIIRSWEVIPMVVICIGAVVGVISFSIYNATSMTDVVFSKKSGTLGDRIDLKNPPHLKMVDIKPADRALPDVADLLLEIEKGEKEMKKAEE